MSITYGRGRYTKWFVLTNHRGFAARRRQPLSLISNYRHRTKLAEGESTFRTRLVSCAGKASYWHNLPKCEKINVLPLLVGAQVVADGFGLRGLSWPRIFEEPQHLNCKFRLQDWRRFHGYYHDGCKVCQRIPACAIGELGRGSGANVQA